jgi:hypothetical protein
MGSRNRDTGSHHLPATGSRNRVMGSRNRDTGSRNPDMDSPPGTTSPPGITRATGVGRRLRRLRVRSLLGT